MSLLDFRKSTVAFIFLHKRLNQEMRLL